MKKNVFKQNNIIVVKVQFNWEPYKIRSKTNLNLKLQQTQNYVIQLQNFLLLFKLIVILYAIFQSHLVCYISKEYEPFLGLYMQQCPPSQFDMIN